MINKRYADIYKNFIYKGEKTPFTAGTLVVFALCFLLLIIATFTQIEFYIPVLSNQADKLFEFKKIFYNPQIITSIFIIFILKRTYSYILFSLYLIVGMFIWPIFVFGFGLNVFQNYLFGYFLGFFFAVFVAGAIFNIAYNLKTRLLGACFGVLTIHIVGILYCLFLAIFNVIDFNIFFPIVAIISGGKILYDLIFSMFMMLIISYIKNIFWACMKPGIEKKKSKNISK